MRSETWTRTRAQVALIGGWLLFLWFAVYLAVGLVMARFVIRASKWAFIGGVIWCLLMLFAGWRLMSAGRTRLDVLNRERKDRSIEARRPDNLLDS